MTDHPECGRRVIVAAGLLRSAPASAQRRVSMDFEDAVPGALPASFTAALTGGGPPPRWVIADDPTSPAGPRVLSEVSRNRTDNRFPLALLNGFAASDVSLTVRFRPMEGRVDQAAGLVLRCRDARNYYVARANALEDNVRLYRVVDGRRIQFAGTDVTITRGAWQLLGLRAEGNRFTVSLDGRTLFSATGSAIPGPGRVGLWTKSDSVTHFDALEAEALR